MVYYRTVILVATCTTSLALAACAKGPPPQLPALPPLTIVAPPEAKVEAALTISASADVNPNNQGRPSPIVVRIYQLRAGSAFNSADFDRLYENDQQALGQELITRDEISLLPGERRTLNVQISKDTRLVGAVAAFLKIADAQWRASVPTPRKGLSIAVEKTRVVLSAAD